MQAVKGYVENGRFYPIIGKVAHSPKRVKAILTILDESSNFNKDEGGEDFESIRQARLTFKGSMKGKIWMSDDFNEPLEEMREYME